MGVHPHENVRCRCFGCLDDPGPSSSNSRPDFNTQHLAEFYDDELPNHRREALACGWLTDLQARGIVGRFELRVALRKELAPVPTLKRRFRGYDRAQTDQLIADLTERCDALTAERKSL